MLRTKALTIGAVALLCGGCSDKSGSADPDDSTNPVVPGASARSATTPVGKTPPPDPDCRHSVDHRNAYSRHPTITYDGVTLYAGEQVRLARRAGTAKPTATGHTKAVVMTAVAAQRERCVSGQAD